MPALSALSALSTQAQDSVNKYLSGIFKIFNDVYFGIETRTMLTQSSSAPTVGTLYYAPFNSPNGVCYSEPAVIIGSPQICVDKVVL